MPRQKNRLDGRASDGFRDDLAAAEAECISFIQSHTADANADGVVVNLSGGLDSTVTAALAVEALGSDAVYGFVLPASKLGGTDARDAEAIAELLGIDHDTIHVQPLLAHLVDLVPSCINLHGNPVVRGNLTARLRMTFAYLAANDMGRLVAGTTNRSELLLGYFTKYGDGASDFLPLGDLYKTEVRALARELDVPEFIIKKQPTAGFWPEQTDRSDLGASYETLDAVLHRYVDTGCTPEELRSALDVDEERIERIIEHYEMAAHKRSVPPTPTRN
jgi:NAD+ synthase